MYCEDQCIPYEAVKKLGSGKVLILAPHPDDEVFGCAGAVIRHVESGDPVQVIIVSDGGYLESESRDEYVRTRRQESIRAGNLLGYVPEFWDIPDREVAYGEKLIARIGEVIDTKDIDLVYAPSVTEIHPDHRSLGMAAAEAVRRNKKNILAAFYEVGVPLQPNRLLDITEVMELKRKAMACFPSQLQQQKYDRHIAALNQFRTYTLPSQVQAAEAFFVIDSKQLSTDPLALYHSEAEKTTFPGSDIEASQNKLVTVIIRSIGREKLLTAALASVALQTYPHIEVLVINAKGKGHPELDQWCGRFPLRVCGTGEPLSRTRAANLGLENARGDYLIFLDDDDLFYPDHTASLIKALKKNPGASAAYSGVLLTEGATGNELSTYNMPYNPLQLLGGNYIPIHATMFHRSLLESGCRFDENLDIFEDWDFWLQISQHTKFIHVNLVTAQYRIHDNFGSNVQTNNHATYIAKLRVYNKWRKKWSDEQLLELMQSAYETPSLEKEISTKNTTIGELQNEINKRNAAIQNLQNGLDEKNATIKNLQNGLDEKNATIKNLQNGLDEKNATIKNLQTELQCSKNEINKLLQSKSWRFTKIFRGSRRILTTKCVPTLRKLASDWARSLWLIIPVSIERKITIKNKLFKNMPFLFKHILAYRNWQESTVHTPSPRLKNTKPEACLNNIADNNRKNYVPILKGAPYTSHTIRLIAFYLPQFHPIPENDAWWGKGFTEWTNVKAAKPQFAGHYQPHIPGDLGYYDLCNNQDIMERQTTLAKLYGFEGFCFYFYWFDGKRLLEKPLLNYLKNKKLNFPFCLCWANENWSRCWDGLDHEILISQKHTPEDDLAFIEYTAQYFQDSRYLRVNGKPLLLVYRPSLLPSAKKTASRWRQWCHDHGIGEIYLAYTQSFEAVNPQKYGFDAAIEFPPNNSSPPEISEQIPLKNDDFTGQIYDWNIFPKRSSNYTDPNYPLFRAVCPSWDNTARRKNKGIIFVNSMPLGFQQWLFNAIQDTLKRFSTRDERLVFVNAWNEWAEGAHLEPDQKYGYAYLEASRMALKRTEWQSVKTRTIKNKSLAVVIHAFYLDIFEEILSRIVKMEINLKLFVTPTAGLEKAVEKMLQKTSFDYEILPVKNHGRDVLPFLKIMPGIMAQGFEMVLKLHTKKSIHRDDGNIWRSEVLDCLTSPANAEKALEYLCENTNVGMIGPENHIVSMDTYWGSNKDLVLALANRIGIEEDIVIHTPFVAGTMFYAKVAALYPLLEISISEEDFEAEAGQVDGTLAHAFERCFSLSLLPMGFSLAGIKASGEISPNTTGTQQYSFADAQN